MINFVCVLKKDKWIKRQPSNYNKEWVNKLYRGIKRNYDKPFNFYCLSNVQTDVITIPLKNDFKYWWSKIELFRRDVPWFNKPVLYLDLDIVIHNNIDAIFELTEKNKLNMLEAQTSEPNMPNSSIMYWEKDFSFLYDNFCKQSKFYEKKYYRDKKLGDQGYIFDNAVNEIIFLNKKSPDLFSWVHPKNPKILSKSSFLIFIGKLKPINNLNLPIVKNNWL